MRAEREEAERAEREALNGVPDMVDDKPQDARARGYRRVNGQSGVAEIKEPTFAEEVLENGDKRITNYNSRGEVEAVSTERDGKIISVDSYDEGVLFETTTYDENGVATSVTRYDKSGNVVAKQEFKPRENVNTHSVIKSEFEKKALRERAAKWAKKLGVKVHVLESYDEVTDEAARKQILEGRTPGWFAGGEVYLYMPHLVDDVDLDRTIVHESVAHKGIKQMLGEEFGKFLDNVWNSMSVPAKAKFLSYVGAGKNATEADRRAAADEYVASIAEKVYKEQGLTAEEKTIWQKFVALFKKKFNADEAKADVMSKDVLDEKDIAKMVLASYETLKAESGKDSQAESVNIEKKASSKIEERINNNLAAVETVKQLLESGEEPSDAQREVISKFDGWAGLEDSHDEIVQRLKGILSDASEQTVETLGNERVFDGLEEAMKRVAESDGETRFSKKGENKKSPNTATQNKSVKATAVSSDLLAKVEKLKGIYNKRDSKRTRGFITDVSRELNLTKDGSSHYRTFSTPLGDITLRVSNHNSKLKEFEDRYEDEGVSIVISRKKNKRIDRTDSTGKSHVDEFFYPKQGLERLQGRPLVQILESIEEFLKTGVYVDKTGLAQPEDSRGIRFRKDDATLIGTHSLTEEKLRKAIKMELDTTE